MQWTNTIVDVDGILVGHAQDLDALTGCTVILCEQPAVGGVDQRGGAPGTRETDLLRPMHMVSHIDAVLLAGGSAYGLDAGGGVMKFLEEQDRGFPVSVGVVPIVPGAVIFDLSIGDPSIRPDALMGYAACENAGRTCSQGNVGAGTGATVGKLLGMELAMKSGVGSASLEILPGLTLGALFVVNAFGDVFDSNSGKIMAGVRSPQTGQPVGTLNIMKGMSEQKFSGSPDGNTVIGVIATNAKFTKEETNKLAQMAQDGIAMTIRPAHTMFDGDTIFGVATGKAKADFNLVAAYAAQVCAEAIMNAVKNAGGAANLPGLADA